MFWKSASSSSNCSSNVLTAASADVVSTLIRSALISTPRTGTPALSAARIARVTSACVKEERRRGMRMLYASGRNWNKSLKRLTLENSLCPFMQLESLSMYQLQATCKPSAKFAVWPANSPASWLPIRYKESAIRNLSSDENCGSK